MDRRSALSALCGGVAVLGRALGMSEWTDYHDVDPPDPGQDDDIWGPKVNNVDDKALSQTPRVGPLADRPASAPDGALYRASDEDMLYRYDGDAGAWSAEGWYYREGQDSATALYSQAGPSDEFEATASIVGTRETGAMIPLVGRQIQSVSGTGFSQVVPPFTFGYLESAPNRVPVLKCVCVFASETSGEYTTVRVGTGVLGVDQPLFEFATGTSNTTNRHYDEVYLNEVPEGTSARRPETFQDANWQVWAENSASGAEGAVYPASTLMLDWEVV